MLHTITMSLSSIRALLIDLSGTIHVENEVIPGAVEAVTKLRDAKVPLKFVTNTTKVSCQCICLYRIKYMSMYVRTYKYKKESKIQKSSKDAMILPPSGITSTPTRPSL